jgi:endogenous inhibitor of DNA gyrase (YacG/DUF329 family)
LKLLGFQAMMITCSICNELTTWEENPYRPFCSERCKLIDLGKWMTEDYVIEGEDTKDREPEEGRPDA